MRKALSLNTQLTKLRSVNNLLKQTIPEAAISRENKTFDLSLCEELKQVIYSLRDIQYMLRGLDYHAHRSTHTHKMNIVEIRTYLNNTCNDAKRTQNCGAVFRHNLFTAYTELGSVEQYLQLKGLISSDLTPAPQSDSTETDDDLL
jgi:hypothetical protein